jgi:PAS domain S-box-containing protein
MRKTRIVPKWNDMKRGAISGIKRLMAFGCLCLFLQGTVLPCVATAAEHEEHEQSQAHLWAQLSVEERAWLVAHPVWRLGVDTDYPPFDFVGQNGQHLGIAADYLELFRQMLGVRIELVPNLSWSQVLDKAKAREIDIVSILTKTKDRSEYLDFTEPLLAYPIVLMVPEDYGEVDNLAAFKGRKVAVVDGYREHEQLARDHPEIIPYVVPSTLQGLNEVIAGKADAMIGNLATLNYTAESNSITTLRVGMLLEWGHSKLHVGVRKDWPVMTAILDKVLAAIPNKQHMEIRRNWVSLQAVPRKTDAIALTDEEHRWLKEHPVVRVASDSSWAPMEFADKDGNYKGIAIDYLRNVEKKLGIRFEIAKNQPWHQLVDKARERSIDMFSCAAETVERTGYLSFTSPYLISPVVIFSRGDVPYVGNLVGLEGKKVAVVKGYATHEILARNHPELNVIATEDIHEAFNMLDSGDVDAYVGSLIVAGHHITQFGHSLIKVAGETPYDLAVGMASRNDWPLFASILQKALDSISEEESNAIYQKWLSVTYEHGFDYSLLWKIAGSSLLVVAVFVFLNRKLKIEVEKQTGALRVSEQQFRLLADNAADVIWTLDSARNVTYISPSVKELRGYTPEEAIAEPFEKKFSPASLNTALESIGKAAISSMPVIFEAKQPCKDGSFVWTEVQVKAMFDADGNRIGVIGASRDITRQKMAEQETGELERQLRQTQKMEAIGTLAGGIAHDFNNILAAILGYAEMVQAKLPPESSIYKKQGNVIKAGLRAKDLVQQILLFSRRTDQQSQPVQPHLIIKEALKLLRSSIPATIEIKKNIPDDCGSILADPIQVHQIIMNLCTNAYHAMRETGGVMTVSLSTIEITEEGITFTELRFDPGTYIKLEVADTGYGMDRETKEKIFNPYFTTKPKGEGTGLGLSVVLGIVKSYGGHINVYSEPGEGTKISVYFPKSEVAGAPAEVPEKKSLPQGNERILLVDDEEAILSIMKTTLEGLGYSVVSHTDSQQALELFQADSGSFDLVVTDMTMPHMTGLELTKHLFAIRPGVPVILCTGFSELINEEKAQALGIRKFLTKPIPIIDMATAIREVLDAS